MGNLKSDKIINEDIRNKVRVAFEKDKLRETRLREKGRLKKIGETGVIRHDMTHI